jgi:hypothetical protein
MEKGKLMVNGNGPIVGAEFSSGEWGIESRLHMLLPQMFTISL